MRSVLLILLLLLSYSALASQKILVKIHELDLGEDVTEKVLAFLSNGQVIKINKADEQFLDVLTEAKQSRNWVQLHINDQRELLAAEKSDFRPKEHVGPKFMPYETNNYVPSVIPSMLEAQQIFEDARKTTKEDNQCFNRAHVWAYEWRLKYNLFTTKAWLFFTRKYIRRFDFGWWFHVAPVFHIMVNGKLEERVADVKYARGPVPIQLWTNGFMRNDPVCPVVSVYSDYANFPESRWCFIMKSSMYYYQPLDLEALEKTGTEKHHWLEHEVRESYREAYDIQ